jgi:hypothetical protein
MHAMRMACGGKWRHNPMYSGRRLLSFSHTYPSMLYAPEGPWNPLNRHTAPVPIDIRTLDSPVRSIGTITNTLFRGRAGDFCNKAWHIEFPSTWHSASIRLVNSQSAVQLTQNTNPVKIYSYCCYWKQSHSRANIRTWHTDTPGFTLTQNKGHLITVLSHFKANFKCCVSEMDLLNAQKKKNRTIT